jgi:hypothetical protein
MSRQYYDPWAKVGEAMTRAGQQYYMSRPNPAQTEARQAMTDKYRTETALNQARLDAPENLKNIFSQIFSPQQEAPSPNFVGPMDQYEGGKPPADVVQQRYQENLPDLFSNAMRFAGNKPGGLGDIFQAFAANAGASPEQLTRAQMGAGMNYANTKEGFDSNQNKDFTLSPGSIRYDSAGKPIISAPFKPSDDYLPPIGLGGDQSGSNEQNWDGQGETVNEAGGLYDKAGEVGGIKGALVDMYSNTLGQFFPVSEGMKEIIEDRQDLITSQNDLVRSLSLNPKMPVAEIKRLIKENPVAPSMFLGSDTAQAQLKSLNNSLSVIRNEALTDYNNPILTKKTRQEQLMSANHIDRFLKKLDLPSGDSNQPVDPQGRKSLDEIFGN